jgi:receptor protein-tyrosine kinase
MSRVHDALRRAGQPGGLLPGSREGATAATVDAGMPANVAALLADLQEVPFAPAPEALLIDDIRPQDAPGEEFRSLRTRLNHLQKLQPIRSVVVTSPSPAEGKSFTAANLALVESQLSGSFALLADFDLRRPIIHHMFQIERVPGLTDFLMGQVSLPGALKRVAGKNLCVMPAGTAVRNPLELMNLPEVKSLIGELSKLFSWVVLDSPPLLLSADANLLGTLTDGTILVVRMGSTTIDMVTRAMQSLCENNVLGVVVNAARARELYSKYTYYYSRHKYSYRSAEEGEESAPDEPLPPES